MIRDVMIDFRVINKFVRIQSALVTFHRFQSFYYKLVLGASEER